jgi:hypothetical protein
VPPSQCVGVRFFVGKLVEIAYHDSAMTCEGSGDPWSSTEFSTKLLSDTQGMGMLRKALGHPISLAKTVNCIVTSIHGMDAASAQDRLIVASRLWAQGISAEYLPHSGVMISLLKRHREKAESMGTLGQEISLEELCGVCGLLQIPYIVVVQPHLLHHKQSVRLRRVVFDSLASSGSGGNEVFVSLNSLASTILSGLEQDSSSVFPTNDGGVSSRPGASHASTHRETPSSSSSASRVECIYVDTDQYYGLDKQVSKNETPQWKAILKSTRGITQRTESYLDSVIQPESRHPTPVVAVDLPFWVLRDFGTCVMKRSDEQSAVNAGVETTERYPKHKRVLKTLSMAIDTVMRRYGYWSGKVHTSTDLLTILLYSKSDDRFDMISLGSGRANGAHETHGARHGRGR